MTDLSEDLHNRWPTLGETTDYRMAVNALRTMSHHHGIGVRPKSKNRVYVSEIDIGKEAGRSAILLEAAAHLVDPRSAVYYTPTDGLLHAEFDATAFEKPPIRSVIAKLDTIKEAIFSKSSCDTAGNYTVRQPDSIDPNIFDIIGFIGNYSTEEQDFITYYKFPSDQPFTHSDGKTYHRGDLIDLYSLMQCVSTRPEMAETFRSFTPDHAFVSKNMMQNMVEQMEYAPKRAAALN